MKEKNGENLCDKKTESKCLVPIRHYSLENTSKFYAEGSVKNLLYMLRLSEHDVTVFWDLATAPLDSISERLRDVVPKVVCNHFSQVNSIQKCLWILRKQFKFMSTKKMKLSFHVHQEYTMNSLITSFSNTALGQQQKCCLQPCCGNMAG